MTRNLPSAAAALTLCIAPLAAQSEGQEVATGEKKSPVSLRAWIFPAGLTQPVTVSVTSAGTEAPKALASANEGAAESGPGYKQVPPGSARIDLKSGEQVLASKSGNFRAETHYTLLAWNNGGRWELQVFNDDLPSPNAPDRPLRLLNFVNGRETELYVDGALGKKLPAQSVEEIRVPAKQVGLAIKVLDPQGGPPSQTSTAYDLAQAGSAYVVVAKDYLGRADPQIIGGGPSPEEPATEAQAPVAPPAPEVANTTTSELRELELERRRAQLAALEASENSPNKIPNAAELKRQIEQEIKQLQMPARLSPSAPTSPPSTLR